MKFTIAVVLTCILVACANVPLTNQIEAASSTAADLAVQIDRLQHQGIISNEQEDKLLDRLSEANKVLRNAYALAGACKDDCSNAQSQLELANQLLLALQTELEKAK
jgi:hypothetical protein